MKIFRKLNDSIGGRRVIVDRSLSYDEIERLFADLPEGTSVRVDSRLHDRGSYSYPPRGISGLIFGFNRAEKHFQANPAEAVMYLHGNVFRNDSTFKAHYCVFRKGRVEHHTLNIRADRSQYSTPNYHPFRVNYEFSRVV